MPYCKFCPIRELDTRDKDSLTKYDRYANCPRCRTNYIFEDNEKTKLIQYSMNTVYKGVAYVAIFDLVNTIFTLRTVSSPFQIENGFEIVTTNALPNITPYNFYQKLGVYILFS
jgi:hypothetical protein